MTHDLSMHSVLITMRQFFEHTAAVIVGLVLMVIGLGLGVTMVMLPVGLVIGLLGVAFVVGGLFARIDSGA